MAYINIYITRFMRWTLTFLALKSLTINVIVKVYHRIIYRFFKPAIILTVKNINLLVLFAIKMENRLKIILT